MDFNYDLLHVQPGTKVDLKEYSTSENGGYTKKTAKKEVKKNIKDLRKYQEMFYANDTHSMLIILQAPDAAGKDGVIRHVLSGINPQGCQVHSFKTPTVNELKHDYMWRHYRLLPERGIIQISNRSHYENVLATKVHPEWILNERIAGVDSIDKIDDAFWQARYDSINAIEKHLSDCGMTIIKFFLHLSKDEQKKRFLSRLDVPEKNWKFSSADIQARKRWDDYQAAYEQMLEKTSTEYAPWYVIPADKKFFERVAVGDIILKHFKQLNLKFPEAESPDMLAAAREALMKEE